MHDLPDYNSDRPVLKANNTPRSSRTAKLAQTNVHFTETLISDIIRDLIQNSI